MADQVVLLDADGRPCGTADRASVHHGDTPYHLAFSSYLFDDLGRVLLTRRSLGKRTWPGVWTNSCCGHPRPGEALRDAVARRVTDELGHPPSHLRLVLESFSYRAVDPGGVVEHELCPVWVGRIDPARLAPDPDEVMAVSWVEWPSLLRIATDAPELLSPWAALQVKQLAAALPPEGITAFGTPGTVPAVPTRSAAFGTPGTVPGVPTTPGTVPAVPTRSAAFGTPGTVPGVPTTTRAVALPIEGSPA